MIGFTLLAFGLTATTILCVVATRESGLMPATVNPFGPDDLPASCADTLPDATYATATLAGDWQSTEVQTIRQAEDVLDWLENHHVRHTELQSTGGKFVVRWR